MERGIFRGFHSWLRRIVKTDQLSYHELSFKSQINHLRAKDTCLKALVSNQGNQDVATSAFGALMLRDVEPEAEQKRCPGLLAVSRCWGPSEAHCHKAVRTLGSGDTALRVETRFISPADHLVVVWSVSRVRLLRVLEL